MIQEFTLIGTFLGIVAALFLMFMPALVELKRPQDAGPRLILENLVIHSVPTPPPVLIDLECEAQIIMTHEKFLRLLPNLESAFSE